MGNRHHKKYMAVVLVCFLLSLLIGCSGYGQEDVIYQEPEKLTIAFYYGYHISHEMTNGIGAFRQTMATFEASEGIDIELIIVEAQNADEYSKKMNNMLAREDSIDMLILAGSAGYLTVEDMIDNNSIANMSEYISTKETILSGIRNDYFFPCAMYTEGSVIDGEVATLLGYEDLEIVEDTLAVKEMYLEWLRFKKPVLDGEQFSNLERFFNYELSEFMDFDQEFSLNSIESMALFKEYAGYLSSRDYFNIPLNNDYEDTYRDIFEPYKSGNNYWYRSKRPEDILFKGRYNPFDLDDINETIKDGDVICKDFRPIQSSGLIVNNNSRYKPTIGRLIDLMYSDQLQAHVIGSFEEVSRVAKAVFNEKIIADQFEKEAASYNRVYVAIKKELYDKVDKQELPLYRTDLEARWALSSFCQKTLLEYGYNEIKSDDELRNKLRRTNNAIFMMVNE